MSAPRIVLEEEDGVLRARLRYYQHPVAGVYLGRDMHGSQMWMGGTGMIDPKKVFIALDGTPRLQGERGVPRRPEDAADTQVVAQPPSVQRDSDQQ